MTSSQCRQVSIGSVNLANLYKVVQVFSVKFLALVEKHVSSLVPI